MLGGADTRTPFGFAHGINCYHPFLSKTRAIGSIGALAPGGDRKGSAKAVMLMCFLSMHYAKGQRRLKGSHSVGYSSHTADRITRQKSSYST